MSEGLTGWTIYLVRRLLLVAGVILGVLTVTFLVTRLLGNPVYLLVGQKADQAMIQNMIHQMGLDRPLYVQYFHYLGTFLKGDWGTSRVTFTPVLQEIGHRLPATLELVFYSLVFTVGVGIPLGLLSAMRPGSLLDWIGQVVGQAGASLPNFWVGLLLIYLFFALWHVAPTPLGRLDGTVQAPAAVTGMLTVDALLAGNMAALHSAFAHLVLPAITLGLTSLPATLQITRETVIDILRSPYIRTARASGLSGRMIYLRYALKNAVVPISTVLAMTFGFLMSGTVLVEAVFAWPGLGLYAVTAMSQFDYEPIIGMVNLSAIFYAAAYLVSDLIAFTVDPRIRMQ